MIKLIIQKILVKYGTQKSASEITGISQYDISKMLNNKRKYFSIDELQTLAEHAGLILFYDPNENQQKKASS